MNVIGHWSSIMTAVAHTDHDTAGNSNGLHLSKRMDTITPPICVKQTQFSCESRISNKFLFRE